MTNEKKTKPTLSVMDLRRFEEQSVKRQARALPMTALQTAITAHRRTDLRRKADSGAEFGTTH